MPELQFIPLQHEDALQHLFQLGHFNRIRDYRSDWSDIQKLDAKASDMTYAVRSFQEYTGLEPDGVLGPLTMQTLKTGITPDGGMRICGCPDVEWAVDIVAEANIPNGTVTWPNFRKPITFALNFSKLPGLTAAQTKEAFTKALADWNSNTQLNLGLGDWVNADVRISLTGHRGGTLAVALLSLGRRGAGSHWQKYDNSNRSWWFNLAQETIAHETGHTLGYSHSKDNSAVMAPTATGRKVVLQKDDIRRAQRDYGVPTRQPDPEPPTPGGGADLEGFLKVTVGGKPHFFDLQGKEKS